IVSISGKGYDAMESRALDAIQAMQRPLDAATFAIALAAFEYRIAGDVQTPLSQADNFGWYAIEGNPSYAPSDAGGEYLRTAASLDPQYVAQVAKRYLENPVVVRVKGTQPK
ncbi:MAG: hypothetical protein JO277_01050, partial [Candidatus Eremiobacteraeota bacterium]|nr:hypothetical protein [Candidatus Eremiobacteraeota bacterium]